jgi:hypothetical protein
MNLEEQIQLHKQLSLKIEELEEQKKALGQSILLAMTDKTLQIGNYLVKRFSRLSISTPLEVAIGLKATKMEETVDKEAIKLLYKAGSPIEGVKEISYIQTSIKNQ